MGVVKYNVLIKDCADADLYSKECYTSLGAYVALGYQLWKLRKHEPCVSTCIISRCVIG